MPHTQGTRFSNIHHQITVMEMKENPRNEIKNQNLKKFRFLTINNFKQPSQKETKIMKMELPANK